MTQHRSIQGLAGLLVALSLGAAAAAGAQADTTRREPARQRVPVSKVVPPVADTAAPTPAAIAVTPRDSAVARAPAAAAPTPRPVPEPEPQPVRAPRSLFGGSGFFIGLGGGVTVPSGTFSDLGYEPGPHVTVPFGWHPRQQAFGVRGTLSFNRAEVDASGNPQASRAGAQPRVYAATLDGVLELPFAWARREGFGVSLYAVGGGGLYHFRGIGGSNLADALSGDPGERRATKWGVNAGGGVEWGVGAGAVFAEARWVNVFTGDSRATANDLRWVPVVIGFTMR